MVETIQYLILVVISFTVSVLMNAMLLPRIIYISKKKRLFDLPDVRKKHKKPISRLGGMSFTPIIILTTLFMLFFEQRLDETASHPRILLFICGLIVVYLLGAKDDLVGVTFRKKFVIQAIASLFIVGSGCYINNLYGLFGIYEIPVSLGVALSVLAVVFTTNALNLIDGADGLASGLSIVALLFFSYVFYEYGMWIYLSISMATVGALIPFFYYNFFHKSRKIFMGDTGALTLGYLLVFLMLRLIKSPPPVEIVPSGHILLILSALCIPLFDAVRVMLSRICSRKHPFSPDRNHIHHKVLDIGFSTKKTVLLIIVMAVLIIAFNWLLLQYIDCTIVLVLNLVLIASVNIRISFLRKKRNPIQRK